MILTNTLKAIAIIAVVAIHILAAQSLFLQQHNLPTPDYFLNLNLFFRFSVPLFVALSGFGLAKSFGTHLPGLPGLLRDYFVRRLFRLLPWYLFWGTIIYLYINYIGQGSATYGSTPIWTLFVFGKIDYHFYFVPMIFVLYLLFPLLWALIRKFPWLMLSAAFLWQIYRYWQLDTTILSDQQQYIQAGSWVFYFVLGVYLALRPKLLSYSPAILLSCLLLFGGLFLSLSRTYSQKALGVDPIIFTRFTQIPVLLYSTGFILSSLFVVPRLISYFPSFLLSLLVSLGEHSYQIYLCHTLILRLAVRNLDIFTRLPFLLSLIVVLAGAYGGSLITSSLLKSSSRLLSLFSPPRNPKPEVPN